jgi:hypothetical protein
VNLVKTTYWLKLTLEAPVAHPGGCRREGPRLHTLAQMEEAMRIEGLI